MLFVVALGIVTVPETVRVFVEAIVTVVVAVEAPKVSAEQVVLVFTVRVVAASAGAIILKFAVPVPALMAAVAPLKVTVPVPALKVPLLTHGPATVIPKVVVVRIPLFVTLRQVAAAPTVTVTPLLIVTASAAVGTAAPPHVAVELQRPVTDAVLAALNAGALIAITSTVNAIHKNRIRVFITLLPPNVYG